MPYYDRHDDPANVKTEMIRFRVTKRERKIYDKLAQEVYGLRNTAELARYVMKYTLENRPTLTHRPKSPAPDGQAIENGA